MPAFLLVRPFVPYFNLAYAIAALVFVDISRWQGNSFRSIGIMLLAIVLVVAKKLGDGPRQRAVLAGDGRAGTGDAQRD